MTRYDWTDQSACLNITKEQRDRYFFPGTSGRPAPERTYDYARQTWCDNCPVKAECLQFAVDNHEKHGLWGGYSPAQRRSMEVFGEIVHGTARGRRQHLYRGEPPCDECRLAYNAYHREMDRKWVAS